MPTASSRSSVRPSTTAVLPGTPAVACRIASGEVELEAHFVLRRAVFVDEQGLFELDDRDDRDQRPDTLHALGFLDGEPCGAVRLYPLSGAGQQWKGDRLAVKRGVRTHNLGAALVSFAVSTAGLLGGRQMLAHVQLPNVRFFEHLGWQPEGAPAPFHGVDHQLMSIPLDPGG